MTHGGVRWKTCSRATSGWIAGTIWIADAPVPITATRSPRRSWSWSQRAEWNVAPPNVPRPAIWGRCGSVSDPGAAISTRADTGPPEVSSVQRPASSSQSAPLTLVPNRIERRRSCSSRDALEVGADLGLGRVGPASSPGWGRTRTSRGARGRRRRSRGRCSPTRCRRRRRCARGSRSRRCPARAAGRRAPRPENPAPMIAMSTVLTAETIRGRRAARASARRSGRGRSSRSGAGPARRG